MPNFPFRCLCLVAIASLWLSLISSVNAHKPGTGIATFYTPPYVPSSCYGNKDEGVMIAAASGALYEGGRACGKKYRVKCLSGINSGARKPCLGGSVVVKIVDFCPSGCRGTIDLSHEAFASIADPDAGVIHVSLHEV